MLQEYLIIRSTVSPRVIRHLLWRGICIALPGIAILLIGGVFFPLPLLQKWGWILVLVSLGLITLGLLPYRRLTRLQLKPNEIAVLDSKQLTFISRGKKKMTIPYDAISKIEFVDHPLKYGIALHLKHPVPSPVIVHEHIKEIEKIRREGIANGNADLFFRFFTRRSYEELISWIREEEESTFP